MRPLKDGPPGVGRQESLTGLRTCRFRRPVLAPHQPRDREVSPESNPNRKERTVTTDANTPAIDNPPSGISQAAIFARDYAKNAAQEMLDAIRLIGRRNSRITAIALGVSMPHQIAFLLASVNSFLHWDNPAAWGESVGLLLLAVLVPVATDFYILNQITTIAAKAAARGSKIFALLTLIIPVGVSGMVNFLAPGPAIAKWLALWVVTLIPLAEAGRAFLRPDFAKIEQLELGVEAQLTRTVERLTEQAEEEKPATAAVDAKALNRQRLLAAERAYELAEQARGQISIAALMRATSCGKGAAKKAIERARAAASDEVSVVG